MKSTRQTAIDILLARQKSAEPVDRILAEQLKPSTLPDPRDTQMVMAMVYGVLRWQGFLDRTLAKFSKHPLQSMKPRTLTALRVGAFQLCFMDRVPPSAAINETVQALKAARQPRWLTGFVNGLLRRIAEQADTLPDPNRNTAVLWNYPSWLVDRWQQRYGLEKTLEICREGNAPPPLVVRVNTKQLALQEYKALLARRHIPCEEGRFAPDALRIADHKGRIEALPGYAQGYFQVQDEAAQLVTLLLGPLPAASYLDACAGLGGKTSHLAQLLPAEGKITAVEPSPARLKRLRENLHRLGLEKKVTIFPGPLEEMPPGEKKFQGILVDAPCSGLGVIRRQPDIRWNRGPDDLLGYQQKQRALLERTATMLAPGGVLVYATCSTEPEENDEVVAWFLKTSQGFRVESAGPFLPRRAAELVDGRGFFRTIADRRGLDGFFAARLIKHNMPGPA